MSLPEIVSREQWLAARLDLLRREKEHTRAHDTLNADRRRLPMVKVTADYRFEGPSGTVSLLELFGDSRQLIIQHVMFGPSWDDPCPSCSASLAEATSVLAEHMRRRDTSFVLVSRAPYAKIAPAARERDISFPWYSSYGSAFNYDYEVSVDPATPDPRYNYRSEPELEEANELPGFSCFIREGDDVFHTYSTYARGTEYIGNSYTLLDLTALGRQEAWEEPKGRVAEPHGADPSFSN